MNVAARKETSPPSFTQPAPRKSILLADSDPDLRLMLGMLLAEEGHDVKTCGNLAQALNAMAEGRFDFVITAHAASGLDGLSLLEAVKQRHPDLPVVVISSRYEKESYIIAMNLGALDYFIAPIDYAAIQRLILTHS